jgi:adenosine kinase
LATYVIETVGTQEFGLDSDDFLDRLTQAYGPGVVEEIQAHITNAVSSR